MLAQATTARGMAATSPVQRRPMLPRSHAAAARPSGHGSTCLPAVAHLRSPVAAAGSGSGISSHAAIKAIKAWLAVPDLLAGASAAVAAWWKPPTLAVQLGTAVVIALIGIGVWLTNIVAKREFDERCKHKKPADVMAELRADSQKRTGRLSVYLAYSAAAHVLGTVVLFGATGVVPSTAAAEHVLTALLMFAGSIVVPDGTEAMWAFCMMRQGAASSGGQQPSTP